LFHFGYPPSIGSMYQNEGSELVAMYRRARAAGVATALDLCMPDAHSASGQADWPRILRLVLPYVDVFMPSFPELLLMLNRPRYDELWSRGAVAEQATPEDMAPLADWALAAGAKVVMLKAGTRGIYLRTAASRASMGRAMPPDRQGWQNRELWAPAYRVASVITTTGAGDSAVAGFLASLLYGCTAERSLSVACAVGACCCEAADTTSGVLSWQATLQRMASGWARLPFDPASTGWRWDETSGVWRGPHDAPA
jgi:sugar/nucleoside kinase (ribokinase family)